MFLCRPLFIYFLVIVSSFSLLLYLSTKMQLVAVQRREDKETRIIKHFLRERKKKAPERQNTLAKKGSGKKKSVLECPLAPVDLSQRARECRDQVMALLKGTEGLFLVYDKEDSRYFDYLTGYDGDDSLWLVLNPSTKKALLFLKEDSPALSSLEQIASKLAVDKAHSFKDFKMVMQRELAQMKQPTVHFVDSLDRHAFDDQKSAFGSSLIINETLFEAKLKESVIVKTQSELAAIAHSNALVIHAFDKLHHLTMREAHVTNQQLFAAFALTLNVCSCSPAPPLRSEISAEQNLLSLSGGANCFGYRSWLTRSYSLAADKQFSPPVKDFMDLLEHVFKEASRMAGAGVKVPEVSEHLNGLLNEGFVRLGLLKKPCSDALMTLMPSFFFRMEQEHAASLTFEVGQVYTLTVALEFVPSLLKKASENEKTKDNINWKTVDTLKAAKSLSFSDVFVVEEKGVRFLHK